MLSHLQYVKSHNLHIFTLRQAAQHTPCPHLLYYFTLSSCHSSCCVQWWAVWLQSMSPKAEVIRRWRNSQSARNNKADVQYCSLCPDCSTISSSCIFLKFFLAAMMGLMSIFVMCLMSVSQLSSHPRGIHIQISKTYCNWQGLEFSRCRKKRQIEYML